MNAIAISAATQTLEIGATGNLQIAAAESITNGTILLDAPGSILNAGAGLTLGTNAKLMGVGTVTASSLTGDGSTATIQRYRRHFDPESITRRLDRDRRPGCQQLGP